MKRAWRVRRAKGGGYCEGHVQRDIGCNSKEGKGKETQWLYSYRMRELHGVIQCGRKRTMSELRVPSSTTCVETMALPSNAQNNAATMPA